MNVAGNISNVITDVKYVKVTDVFLTEQLYKAFFWVLKMFFF